MLQNIDCGYSLEPPHQGGSNVEPPHQGGSNVYQRLVYYVLSKNFHMKFLFFTTERILCILHGQVFVMAIELGLTQQGYVGIIF